MQGNSEEIYKRNTKGRVFKEKSDKKAEKVEKAEKKGLNKSRMQIF